MEDFYRQYTIVQYISYEPDRRVMLAAPLRYYEDLPEYFIITSVNSREVPIEVIIHKTLSEESEDVVRLYDHWESNNQYFFCTEFLAEHTLREDLEQRAGYIYKMSSVFQNCLSLSKILKLLHSKCCVHQSISTESIYMTNTGGVKLGCFDKSIHVNQSMRSVKEYGDMNDISHHIRMKIDRPVDFFREDIWAMGKVFLEMALGRIYPELTAINIELVKTKLQNIFSQLKYPLCFIELIMGMLETDSNPYLNAAEVEQELTEQILLYENEYLDSEFSNYEPDPNNDSIYIDEYTECWNILPFNEVKKENEQNSQIKIIEPIKDVGVVEMSVKEEFESRSVSVSKNERVNENEVSPIASQTYRHNIASMINSHHQLIINQNYCGICNDFMDSGKFKLNCSHYFHLNCISSSFKNRLINATKFCELECPICKINLENNVISKLIFQDPKVSIKATLMIFATTESYCPTCNKASVKKLINKRLKAKNARCKECHNKFCTFCNKRGGHMLYCDSLKNFKEGKPVEIL